MNYRYERELAELSRGYRYLGWTLASLIVLALISLGICVFLLTAQP